jgi:DNA-binding response OmpR family regulator
MSQARPARVLVVGADERVRGWVCHRMRSVGFKVVAAEDVAGALVLTRADPPDLIVVSHVIGWLDVRCLLGLLRRDVRTATTSILLIAGHVDDGLQRFCRQLGVTLVVRSGNGTFTESTAPAGTVVAQ